MGNFVIPFFLDVPPFSDPREHSGAREPLLKVPELYGCPHAGRTKGWLSLNSGT